MTSAAIAKLLDSYLSDVEGRPGFWRGMRDEVMVYVFSDDSHDRMRIMAPIGELREVEPKTLQVLLQANYDRALDARYALRGREVWAVAVHPLATLAPDDFAGFIEQTVKLVHNTGTTYASSDLMFQSPPGEEDGEESDGGDGENGEEAGPSDEPEEPAE
jgi:hypothetical protein